MIYDTENIAQLLTYALHERRSEAITYILEAMHAEPTLETFIIEQLSQWLTTEPDAVYFFGRIVLGQMMDEAWLALFHASGRASLQIVITQGDTESIMEWLRLIAREPSAYQMNDILREGILSAQKRAHEDGILGGRLLIFALKRTCDLVAGMMADEAFVSALTPPIGTALQTFQASAIKESIELGRDVAY